MNWIPKIEYTELFTGTPKSITFDSQPEDDPYNEVITGNFEESMSSSGNYQRQWNYNEQQYTVDFKFQSSTVMAAVDTFIQNHALIGGEFDYYPSSDETDFETYRLKGNSFRKSRPVFEGSGPEFEYNFKFSMIRTIGFELEGGVDVGAGAINETQFDINNNQAVAADVTGLLFDDAITRSAFITYHITRTTTGVGASELSETGTIKLVYEPTSAEWEFDRVSQGDAGVTLTCTVDGQFQYTSTNMTGTVDIHAITFRASTMAPEE